jgi:hypothetical protein
MEKLTIKLIKNKYDFIEYSILKQSDGIKRGYFKYDFIIGNNKIILQSESTPEFFSFLTFRMFIRGVNIERDNRVHKIIIDSYTQPFLNLITKLNIQKLKQELIKEGIEFNLVTNLYSTNINSKF